MESQLILDEFLAVLTQKGVTIRTGLMGGGGGGMCKIKGSDVFFVDTQCPVREMAAICAEAVSEIVDVEAIYLRPQTRQFVEKNIPS
jgi:hypothetical protein